MDKKKLPNVASAEIPKPKLADYLLSVSHRRGKSKAAFFTAHGFRHDSWHALADSLRQHATNNLVSAAEETAFGVRYIIDGPLPAPTGRSLQVRSVWFIDKGRQIPRFVTAYPL